MSEKIIRSIYPDENIPENLTIPGFLRLNCKEDYLGKISQICSDTGVEYTFRQVLDQTGRFANALKNGNLGLNPGDHVAILLPNVPEYLSIFLGIMEAGLVSVPVNPGYTIFELEPMFQNASIKAIIALPENLEKIHKLVTQLKIKNIITVGNGEDDSIGSEYFKLIREFPPLGAHPHGDGKKPACILFSSGTSGIPKGVVVSHVALIAQLILVDGLQYRIKGQEIMLGIVPRFHMVGTFSMLNEFYRGSCHVGMQMKFSPAKFIQAIKNYKPTVMWLMPAFISIIASSPALSSEDFQSLAAVIFGGAVPGNVLVEKFYAKIGCGAIFQCAYGSTESGCFSSLTPVKLCSSNRSSASVGLILPNSELKVVDTKTSVDLGPHESGEICLRGISVFQGYLNNDEATRAAIDDHGWYHSGDFGHYDDRGYLYIDGRIKDLIKVNSFQVSPEEIENIVRKHDKVSQVVVFGIPDDKYQEVPRAMIVPKDSSLTVEEIHEFLKDKLIAYKQLRGGVRFVEGLPMNATGKIVRRAAKELDAKLI